MFEMEIKKRVDCSLNSYGNYDKYDSKLLSFLIGCLSTHQLLSTRQKGKYEVVLKTM